MAVDIPDDVYLNGLRQMHAIDHDVIGGWVRRYRTNAYGKKMTDSFHQPIIDIRFGTVTLKPRLTVVGKG